MSTLEIDFCNQSIVIDVFDNEAINVIDFFDVLTIAIPDDFTGQNFSIAICDDLLNIAFSDATAIGFLSIRDRFNALIYDRFNDHINMRAA